MNVHELAESVEIASGDGGADLDPNVLNFAQAANNGLIVATRCLILFLQNGRGIADVVRVEKNDILFQGLYEIHAQIKARDFHLAVLGDVQDGQAAERRHVLVLLSNGLS